MRIILFLVLTSISILAQDFLPYSDLLEQRQINKMRDNKVKRMEVVSYNSDSTFKPISTDINYAYNYEYNELGQIVLVYYYNPGKDIKTETTFAYNDNGILESIIIIETTGISTQAPTVASTTTFFVTEKEGRIDIINKYVTKSSGGSKGPTVVTNTYFFKYASGLSLTTILDSVLDKSSGEINTLYQYDKMGNVVKKTSLNSETVYFYDDQNNLTKTLLTENGTNYEIFNQFDANGNLIGVTANNEAYGFNWVIENNKLGLAVNGYSTFHSKSENQKVYEYNTFIYTYF